MPDITIPQTITVHLGAPGNYAQNVTLNFPDYIKNVASSEIYPTWPENAIRSNIYAQITYALNRVFTEHYRSQGYDFDITNSTQYDQFFVPGRDIFDNISRITDEIFDSFIERQGTVGPIFAQYCNGTTVTCAGLSQWGTVPLAKNGYTPYRILQNYYGSDINIEQDVPTGPNIPSYPGTAIRNGDRGNTVRALQVRLNRISHDYPSIPKIPSIDGIFGDRTESAVRQFQKIFGLTQDGIVGKATWYKIINIYNAVKRLSELDSEGISISEFNQQYPDAVRPGDSGDSVTVLQHYLSTISQFYQAVPPVALTSIYDEATQQAVVAFQKAFGLDPDGIVGDRTWQEIYRVYLGIITSEARITGGTVKYGGTPLRVGDSGEAVETLQLMLSYIADAASEFNAPPITGLFGPQTRAAVLRYQELLGLPQTGIVDEATWNSIASVYSDLSVGNRKNRGQFSGETLKVQGDTV